ncbi:MAG: hypothetical protein NVV83_19670 [Afipia sp.]|nr:hypothetical protein [Afipia sp.]
MTPPTLHELAGIFMLALATTILISHPSAGFHPPVAPVVGETFTSLDGFAIDGIENAVLPR